MHLSLMCRQLLYKIRINSIHVDRNTEEKPMTSLAHSHISYHGDLKAPVPPWLPCSRSLKALHILQQNESRPLAEPAGTKTGTFFHKHALGKKTPWLNSGIAQ